MSATYRRFDQDERRFLADLEDLMTRSPGCRVLAVVLARQPDGYEEVFARCWAQDADLCTAGAFLLRRAAEKLPPAGENDDPNLDRLRDGIQRARDAMSAIGYGNVVEPMASGRPQ